MPAEGEGHLDARDDEVPAVAASASTVTVTAAVYPLERDVGPGQPVGTLTATVVPDPGRERT